MRQVRPVSPPAPYLGGKRNLSARIVERIGAIPHDLYAEPFVGMGGVFLRRPSAPKVEVINDLNREVATLFRVLQRHYTPFLDMLRWQLSSRAEFERLRATDPATLTDLERAARFLYLQRTAFGGKPSGQTFGVTRTAGARFNITRLAPVLEEVHDRLAGVTIECLPYADFIRRYDGPGALFYVDPPYWGGETDYGPGLFGRDDFAALIAQLKGLQGRFILSLNDVPEVRKLVDELSIEAVETTYTIRGTHNADRRGELLVFGP